jgi:colanic acid biosynthesis glycosyl transferase WcaI
MNRIIFLNRFFFPDQSATSQLLSDLAFHLASSGRSVHVVTSRQLYDDPRAELPPEEIVRGVHIHRLATTQFGRSALPGRSIDYLSFYRSLWRFVLGFADPGDILVAKTDPPLLSVLAMRLAERRGAHLVNWLQDLYPEVAMKLGVRLLHGPLGQGLSHLRDRSLQAAAVNIVVGERMAERLLSRGIDPQRVSVIPNWTNDGQIAPIHPMENPLRREWHLEQKFVVGYSGNLGRAHEFETVVAAAERLRSNPNILFLFVGNGHRLPELARRVQALGLCANFRIAPYQDKATLKYSLSVPDVHWVSLDPDLEGFIVPSKFFGIAAAGRPIIAITASNGEIARLVRQHACGVVIEPGNSPALADAIVYLAADRQRTAEMGRRARVMLDAHFSRRQALRRWQRALDDIGHAATTALPMPG